MQNTACTIILGKQYNSYQSALAYIDSSRKALSSKFDKKAIKSAKYSGWFVEDTNPFNTRREGKTVKEA